MVRGAHLVGSVPADDAEQAMRLALERLGPQLATLPDGETGERRNWIQHLMDSFREHPRLELAAEGDWSDYDHIPRFRVRGAPLDAGELDLGHHAAFEASYPTFQRLRAEWGRDDLRFQVGIASPLDLVLFTLGPARALRNWPAFRDATVREIAAIHAVAGDDVVFQLEVPAELAAVARAPAGAQRLVARTLAPRIAGVAARAPGGARFGLHLCLGDLAHTAYAHLRDAAPIVHLIHALLRRWPAAQPLDYVHAPFAAGQDPPPLTPAFYRPLTRLRLPAGIRFVAGVNHEDRAVADQRRLVRAVERALGREEVAVAAACGLGRRDRATAEQVLEQAAALGTD